ncbi:MAG: ATP-grasp domain-containing protein [Candidatus Methanofastidiosia archaeon]|jgi:predicted ATP-grasp superfamily ATP-dependent carboligase
MRYVLLGFSTRALAESCVKAGKVCTAIDFFGDLDQEKICDIIGLHREYKVDLESFDPSLFLEVINEVSGDRIVYVGPLENYPQILATLNQKYIIVGNDPKTVQNVRTWENLVQFCKKNSILYPKTLEGEQYVVKPKKSGGGVGITRLSGHVIQKFVKGKDYSVSFLGNGVTAEVVSVNEQLMGKKEFGAKEFWYCGNITPVPFEDMHNVCEKLVKEFKLKGSCGLDFVVDNNSIYMMEVNPRPQATLELVEKAFNVNMFLLHENAVNGKLQSIPGSKRVWGKAIVYAEQDITMPDTTEWLYYKWIKDVPHPFENIKKSDPMCTVLADGQDRDDCFEHLVHRSESIKNFLNYI